MGERLNSNRISWPAGEFALGSRTFGVALRGALVSCLMFSCAGCTLPKRPYDARPLVTFADLGARERDRVENGYNISTLDFDGWRFPARMVVARVTVADTDCRPNRPRLVFLPIEGIACPPWNELIVDLPAVSEVFFLQQTVFPRKEISVTQIARRAARYGARLCLVYSESDFADEETRVIGSLIDTRSLEVVATISAEYKRPERGYESDRPRDRASGDNRHTDSRYLALAEFRSMVHDCLLDLIDGQGQGGVAQAFSR